jgi:hypothetical protein
VSQAIIALVGAFILMKLFGGGGSRSVRSVRSAPPTRNLNGERRRSAKHEAAHLVVNRRLGGRSVGAVLLDDSNGYSEVYPRDARSDAVMSLAGEAATGSRGAASDRKFARKACRREGMSMSEARREARRMVRKHSGDIGSVGRKLARGGRV